MELLLINNLSCWWVAGGKGMMQKLIITKTSRCVYLFLRISGLEKMWTSCFCSLWHRISFYCSLIWNPLILGGYLLNGMLVWHFEIEKFSSCATMYFPVLHKFGCQDWEGEVLKHGFSWQCNIYATPQNSLHC